MKIFGINTWNPIQVARYAFWGAAEGLSYAVGASEAGKASAKRRVKVKEEAYEAMDHSEEMDLQEKMIEERSKRVKAEKIADFQAVQEVNKVESSTYKSLVQARIASKSTAVLQKSALAQETESMKTQQEVIESQSAHFKQSKEILTATQTAQKDMVANQQEVAKLQQEVNAVRKDVAEKVVAAAEAHMAAVEEAQGKELAGFQVATDTRIMELRHDFAMQVISKVADLEGRKIELESQLKQLQAQTTFDTQAKKLEVEKNITLVKAEKDQYIAKLTETLTLDELEEVTSYMADKMSAESFAKVQEKRAESREAELGFVNKGVESAGEARVSETAIATEKGANTAEEAALAALKNDIREQLCENFAEVIVERQAAENPSVRATMH